MNEKSFTKVFTRGETMNHTIREGRAFFLDKCTNIQVSKVTKFAHMFMNFSSSCLYNPSLTVSVTQGSDIIMTL